MRYIDSAVGCSLLAGLIIAAPLRAEDKPDFNWSWEEEGGSSSAQAPAMGVPAGKMDPETYNQLLKENLTLRRKLQDTDRGSEAMREENARLQHDMTALQGQITTSTDEIARLKRESSSSADPEQLVEMEARLAAAESARLQSAQDLASLESRLERAESKPPVNRGAAVKPGSDLFVSLERENAELRDKLADVETEKQKVLKQLRDVESEVEAKGELEAQMASASSESDKHKMVIRKLLERLPALEQDLAETQSREREKDAELSQREREMRALKTELDRREHRLKKAERVAALLAQARSEVRMVDNNRQRDMYYNMGVVFANRGQFREAEREYLRALRQDPTDADTHYNLAVLYDQNLKQYRQAASHYRRYLKLRPNAPDSNEVRLWIAAAETR